MEQRRRRQLDRDARRPDPAPEPVPRGGDAPLPVPAGAAAAAVHPLVDGARAYAGMRPYQVVRHMAGFNERQQEEFKNLCKELRKANDVPVFP